MGCCESIQEKYKLAWENIILPMRCPYTEGELGMDEEQIWESDYIWQKKIVRQDFEIKNSEGFSIVATYYYMGDKDKPKPCVLYLHAKGGCRIEIKSIKRTLFKKGEEVCLCTFDFPGNGKSEGTYVTLGLKEKQDTRLIINYLKTHFNIGKLLLWGRSMGAVTAILFAQEFQEHLCGLVLDSPFGRTGEMISDVVRSKVLIPRCLISCLLCCCLGGTIKKKTGEDVMGIDVYPFMPEINLPLFIMVAINDVLARPDRVKTLYDKYAGEMKEFYLIEGDHPSAREQPIIDQASDFILKLFDRTMANDMGKGNDPMSHQFQRKQDSFGNDLIWQKDFTDPEVLNDGLNFSHHKGYKLPTNIQELLDKSIHEQEQPDSGMQVEGIDSIKLTFNSQDRMRGSSPRKPQPSQYTKGGNPNQGPGLNYTGNIGKPVGERPPSNGQIQLAHPQAGTNQRRNSGDGKFNSYPIKNNPLMGLGANKK